MITLHDLKPKHGRFTLDDKEYLVRPFTLNDEIWLKQTFNKEIFEKFSEGNPNFEVVARIIYHQLVDKSDFAPKEVIEYDEEGRACSQKIGGYKLLASRIIGIEKKVELINALNECMGISQEVADKILEEKKNQVK